MSEKHRLPLRFRLSLRIVPRGAAVQGRTPKDEVMMASPVS